MNQSKSKESDLHRIYKHFIKFKCVPQIYSFILSWIWDRKIDRPILEFIEINKDDILKKKADHHEWSEKKKDFLNIDKDYSYVSFLHDLLPCVSKDSIARSDSSEYSERIEDEKSVEFLLNKVKHIENEINYEDVTPICDELLENLKISIEECLAAAGKRYDINETDVLEAKEEIINEFVLFSYNYFEAKTSRTEYIREILDTFCASKLREIRYNHTVHLPVENKEEVNITYDYDNVQIWMKGWDDEYFPDEPTTYHSSSDAFKAVLTCDKFFIIMGHPGCGKTEFLKCIELDFLKLANSHLKYRLPIYINSSLVTSRNIGGLCKNMFPEYLSIFSMKNIMDALREGNGVIFLIDDYDSLNSNERKFLSNIFKFVAFDPNNQSKFLITSRKITIDEASPTCTAKMTNFPKNTRKVDFLRRYGDEIGGCNIDKLVTDYENLEDTEQILFNTPLQLKFFCSLSINGTLSKQKFKSEICIYEAIIVTFEEQIKSCLIEGKVDNCEAIAKEIIEILSDHCLEVFSKGKYYFDEEDFKELLNHYCKTIPNIVNIESILKIFLFLICNNNKNTAKYYYFSDKSICDYLVMKAILRNDSNSSNEKKNSSILSNIDSDAHFDLKDFQFRRYATVVKFLLKYTTQENITIPSIFRRDLIKYSVRTYDFWLDLLSSPEYGKFEISEMKKKISTEDSEYWYITEGKFLKKLAMLLEVIQPTDCLKIKLNDPLNEEEEQDLHSVMKAIRKNYRKDLVLQLKDSYENFKLLKNDFYKEMEKSKINLVEFKGCVSSEEHVSILSSKYLYNLIGEQLTCSKFRMSSKFEDVAELKVPPNIIPKLFYAIQYTDSIPVDGKFPLRINERCASYTSLCIVDIPADGLENAFKMINYLVPANEEGIRKCSIILGRCLLNDTDVAVLTDLLNAEGITTDSKAEFENSEKINESGICQFCEYHTEESLPCWRLFLVGCLDIDGSKELSQAYTNLEIGGTVRSFKMVMNEDLNEKEEETIIKFLSLLESDCEREICFDFQYSYDHFKPISECIMMKLKLVNGKFKKFRGAISTQDSLIFLKEKVLQHGMEDLKLSVTFDSKLNLKTLLGLRCCLHFNIQYTEDESDDMYSTEEHSTYNEEKYKYPSLSLDSIPAHGKNQAFRIIKYLAPEGTRKFESLNLKRCSLSKSDVNELKRELLAADFRIGNERENETDDEDCSVDEDQDDAVNIKIPYTFDVESINEIHHLRKLIKSVKNVSKVNISLDDELTRDDEDQLKQLLSELNSTSSVKKLSLKLNYSHDHFKQIREDVLMELLNVKSRLVTFKGAVSSNEVLNVLKTKQEEHEFDLQISSSAQININYSILLPTICNLCCTIQYSDNIPKDKQTVLPENAVGDLGIPYLKITDIPTDGKENALHIIRNVDPNTGRVRKLKLIRCSLSESDVKDLMLKVFATGIKAGDGEETGVKKILNDDKDSSPAYELSLPYKFTANSIEELEPLVELLEYGSYFIKIEITLPKDLTGEDEEKLKMLFKLMKSGPIELELSLKFEYSYWNFKPISEDVLMELQDARCTLYRIQLAISSRKVFDVLKSKMNEETSSIEWSVPASHDLNLKNMYPTNFGNNAKLRLKYSDTYTNHEKDGDSINSAKHGGSFVLSDVPSDGKKNAYIIIRDVAKNFTRFSKLTLERCFLLESQINELLQELSDAGISAGMFEDDQMRVGITDPEADDDEAEDYATDEGLLDCEDDEKGDTSLFKSYDDIPSYDLIIPRQKLKEKLSSIMGGINRHLSSLKNFFSRK